MSRNKYPEITVEKILETARHLFLEKGYDNTTIQDIVDGLGGLTKGAIYHHFKSKEEIMVALSDKMFLDNNPFVLVRERKDLNGLQKMKEVIRLNQSDTMNTAIEIQAIPLLKNPRIFTEMVETNRRILSPLWLELIEEGIKDGSIKTDYPKEIAELIPFLGDVWLYPAVYPATEEEIFHKFMFLKEMLEKMGVPVIDDEMVKILEMQISNVAHS